VLENLTQDLRYAGRMLCRSPGFTVTAIVALALGIGATTAIFTVVNKVLLQPLPYPEPEHLVELELEGRQGPPANITSIPKFIVWREQTQVFQDVTAFDPGGPGVNLTGGDRPEQLVGLHVTASFFRVFGAPMAAGRPFTDEEDRPGGPKIAVVSNGLWHRQFGSDPNLVGRTIELGGEPYTVAGVLGSTFSFDPPAEIYLPLRPDPASTDQAHYLRATARLKPGVTVGMAKAAMKLTAEQFRRKFPEAGPGQSFTAEPLRDTVVGDVRPALLILVGAVGFVLLIACANVANLLLARATGRRREITIRATLGAGRKRIILQLLTESVLLSLAAGVFGLVLGYFGVRALIAINPGNIPRIGDDGAGISLDWRVLAFTLLVSVLTGIVFGLIPALNASRADLNSPLKESGARSGAGLRQNKVRSLLVVTEMAMALVLLVGAALLIRTFMQLRGVNPGFDAHKVMAMDMALAGARFEKTAGVAQLVREAEQRVESLPGVAALASTSWLPLQGGFGLPFIIEGRPLTNGPAHGGASWSTVSPRYFEVFHIALLRGRVFRDQDDAGSTPVVIINEGMAKQYWGKGDPIGRRITIGKGVGPEFEEPPREIVGIVGDVRDQGLDAEPDPVMYIPVSQVKDGVTALNNRIVPLTFAVRTTVQPFSLSADIQRELRVASGGLPVGHIRSMQQVVEESTARSDFNTTILTIFAGVALLLAAIGIHGLMTYSVEQRTPEIGLRMALGAEPHKVRNMVVAQGMRLALIGVVLGVGAALGLTRLISALLFGVKAWDPLVFVSVPLLLCAVALAATYVPARRASRVDPIVSLRYE
jgi:putative ABC transport system permease protein